MKINIVLIFGGTSVEHEVAVISALQAANYLNKEKYNIFPLYIAKNGEMYTGNELLKIESFKNVPALINKCHKATMVRQGEKVNLVSYIEKGEKIKYINKTEINIAFPVVHGTFCEDGTIAGFLELLRIPYVGCDVVSAANGMDKVFFKNILEAQKIPVLPCISFTAKQWVNSCDQVKNKIDKIGYPVIVKPVNLGSSVGISKVSSADELQEKISLATSFSNKLLVEKAISSLREINCSVVGDSDECEASVLEEPVMHDDILSYADKYMSNSSSKGMSGLTRKIPAELSEEKAKEITELAIKTFMVLGCSGVSRIDFLIDKDDNDKVYVNEINTIPGSLSFYLWEPKGVKYGELLDRLIKLGFDRARKRKNLMLSYDTNILANGSFGAKGAKKLH